MAEDGLSSPELDSQPYNGITFHDIHDIRQRLKALELQLDAYTCRRNTDKPETDVKIAGVGFRDKVRRKPTKSSSFNERSSSTSRRRSPYRHTVPSDRDESTRIQEFRNECLSKAIKCNTVDIVNYYTRKDNPGTFHHPSWLSAKERNTIEQKNEVKYQTRAFLTILREKDFHTVRKWIQEESDLEEPVKEHIWNTFQEFNDTERIMKKMCTACKVKMNINISDVIDHFSSIEIISEDLYKEIITSEKTVGTQNAQWIKVGQQCTSYPIPSYVLEAFRLAIVDIIQNTDSVNTKEQLEEIIKQIDSNNDAVKSIFECRCKDIYSRELQPISLLKSMSLLQVYSSPPARRKINEKQHDCKENMGHDDVDAARPDSPSSNESFASHLKMHPLKFNETEASQGRNNNNFVSIDDRWISADNSRWLRNLKGRKKMSKSEIIRRSEKTRPKIIHSASFDKRLTGTFRDNLNTNLNGEANFKTKSTESKHDSHSDVSVEFDTSSSTDSLESPVDYRRKTQKLFEQQQVVREKGKRTLINIKAAQVNIDSTLISRHSKSSAESASA